MKKILVIEDTSSIIESILEILKFEGFEGYGAKDGKKGVEMAKNINPDLIICDVMMPEMDGYEVISQIKRIEGCKNTPFIFLTALSTKQDFRMGMDLGADDYLTKPFTTDQLITVINKRLDKKEAEIEEMEKDVISMQESISKSIPNELLSPLNSIMGINKLMNARAGSLTALDIEGFTKDIGKAVDLMLKSLKKIVYFTEIELIYKDDERKKILSNSYLTNVRDIIMDKVNELGLKYGRSEGINVEVEELILKIDENHFSILLNELLDNAFKFSKEDDIIKISLDKDNMARLVVFNEGVGILPDNLKKIKAFRQFNKDLYGQEGMGLGLSIVSKIVELYGGQFTINSQINKDTRAIVLLPLANLK